MVDEAVGGLGQTLDALLADEHADGAFEGVALVAQGDEVVLRKGYGCRDRNRKRPATPESISDIGSVAKTFTAAAILRLEAAGLLSGDDRIERFYPDAPLDKRAITLRQLLVHTSGLEDFHADSDFEPMTRDEAEARILALPLLSAPGAKEAYSNAGYTLLAAIVERASGQSFDAYVRRELLVPAGLADTGWYGSPHIDAERLARGYGGERKGRTTFERELTWALAGGGGMVSTVDDLHRWYRWLATGRLLDRDPARIFARAGEGRWSEGSWRSIAIGDAQAVEMGGSTDFGYTAKIQYLAQADTLVVLLFNGYSRKYGPGTHHAIANRVLVPAIVAGGNNRMQP